MVAGGAADIDAYSEPHGCGADGGVGGPQLRGTNSQRLV
jgi:hypothetical protein